MSEQRDRERDGRVPAARDAATPVSTRGTTPDDADTRGASGSDHPDYPVPAPAEFVSLTYTIPYHLVARTHEIARDSFRSQSEVVADALRLYARTWKARRTRSRVSTVEGFSYQEVAIADVLVDEELDNRLPPATPAADGAASAGEAPPQSTAPSEPETAEAEAPPPAEVDPEPAEEPEAKAAEDGAGADTEHVENTEIDAPEGETDADEASGDDAGHVEDTEDVEEDVDVEEGLDDVEGEGPSSAGPVTIEEETTGETAGAVAVEEPSAGADLEERTSAVAGEAEPEVDATPDAPAPRAVATAVKDGEDTDDADLREIADPAASVRLELEAIAEEPIHSLRVQRALEKISARIDAKDHSPEDHSATVAETARKLARIRGLSGRELLHVQLTGLAHDIGKACIPDHILAKRRPSPEEMAMIRKYPEFGAELLRIVPSLEPIVPLVASHQERWNGNGYPDGRQGNDIPVAAQVVAICDVYQVLINERHYRPAYTEERARQIIRQNVGTLWNPDIARSFLKMINGDEPDEE